MKKKLSKSKIKVKSRKAQSRILATSPYWDMSGWHNISGGDDSTSNYSTAGIMVSTDIALKVAAVYACCNVLAETIACLPIGVYGRLANGGKEKLKNHYLYDLLHYEPNSWQTPVEFVEFLVMWTTLRGNAYNEIKTGKGGIPIALMPIRADKVKPEWVSEGVPRYQITMPDGKTRPVSKDRMNHIRNKSIDGLNGLSPITLGAETIGTAIAVRKYGAKMFTSSGTKRIALQHPKLLNDTAYKHLRESWENKYGGSDNQGKAAILEEGMTANVIGMSLEDAQRIESEQFSVEDICRFYRMPPHKVQHLLHATYSNIEEQSIEFGSDTILPWCRRIESSWNRDLIYEKTEFVEFNLNGLMRGKATERADYYTKMFAVGAYSTNDILALENENDIGELGNKRYISTNLQELGAKPESVKEPQPPQESQKPEENPQEDNADMKALSIFIDNAAERIANAWNGEYAKLPEEHKTGEVFQTFKDKHWAFAMKTFQPIWAAWVAMGHLEPATVAIVFAKDAGKKEAWIKTIKDTLK